MLPGEITVIRANWFGCFLIGSGKFIKWRAYPDFVRAIRFIAGR